MMRDLIQRRIETFWGYGSFDAPVWFVGMEEGIGPMVSIEEVERELEIRFKVTDYKAMSDMRHGMEDFKSHMKWFQGRPPIQPTWKYPIALYLYMKSKKKIPSSDEIREHQKSVLGDESLKETCTIELMPLPSRKANESTWLYKKYGLPNLSSRKEYLGFYKQKRVEKLKKLIEKHSPKLVICYSIGYLSDWINIIGEKPREITPQMYFIEKNNTAYCILPQGVAFGMSYKRLYEFAEKIYTKTFV